MTGGRAFVRTNDLARSVARASDDSSAYYEIAYPLKLGTKPGWHKLQVKVNESHVEVRARAGFAVAAPAQDTAQSSDLAQALGSPLTYAGVPLRLQWLAQRGPAGEAKTIDYELSIFPQGVHVDESNGNAVNISVVAVARKGGQSVRLLSRELGGHLSAQSVQTLMNDGITYRGSFQLPPGEYYVKFAARENLTGRVGAVTGRLAVE